MDQPQSRPRVPDEGPPIFGAWERVYAAVLLYLALLIGILFLITRAFRY